MSENKKNEQAIVPANQELTSQLAGLQINDPSVESAEARVVSQSITERVNHAVDKAVTPSSKAAQNIVDNETFNMMIADVRDSDLPHNEKVELYKELFKMKDNSDLLHAALERESIRVQADAIAKIQASQGLTWEQIGYGMKVAGRIGAKALRLWLSMRPFLGVTQKFDK
ncbi:MAG: hypothetical protein IJI71_10830 [Clostridia bacterium]|nr:hypothetical protein [Clostridia bacterium]